MRLDTADLKADYEKKLAILRRDLAEGHTLLQQRRREGEVLAEQVTRIEGAKLVLEQLLGEVAVREKEDEARRTDGAAVRK